MSAVIFALLLVATALGLERYSTSHNPLFLHYYLYRMN